jgi:hypothetical protein
METTTVNATLVDMGGLQLERHVREAFEDAWRSSDGRPLTAADLLRAAIRNPRSEAFREVANMFPDASPEPVNVTKLAPLNFNAVPLVRPLADSFAVAEGFVMGDSGMWGRDFVAMALLAHNDDSLARIAKESGLTVVQAEQRWLDFVRRNDKRRAPEEWAQWWRAAGVSSDGGAAAPTAGGKAYLLTWNPARYSESQLEDRIKDPEPDGTVSLGWSSGNDQSMQPGERVFLLRQGEVAKRGLVGVGRVIGSPEQRPHWDTAQRAQGRKSWIVDVRWEAIAVDPMIELSTLRQATGEEILWATQLGGVRVEPRISDVLERLWPGAWERRRHKLDPLRPPQVAARQLIASFDPDSGDPPDSLHIDRYVDAFARVAASKDLKPPLSVGLFGDWGAGKSYFMHRVRERIDVLTKPDEGSEDTDPYLHHVCQIEFNAWHYAETDLWASLVGTLFNQLRRYLDGPDTDGDEFNKLLNELEIASALQEEAQQQLDAAGRSLKAAQRDLSVAQTKLDELPPPQPPTDAELRDLLGKTVKEGFQQGTETEPLIAELESLFQNAYELTGQAEFKQAQEGIEKGTTTVGQASLLVDDAKALASRAGFWWRLMTAAKLPKTPQFWAVLLAVLLAIVAIPVIFVFIQSQTGIQIGWAAGLLEAATIAGAAVTWVRTMLARAAPMINRLDWIQATIQRKIDEAKTKDQRTFEAARNAAARAESEARRAVEQARDRLQQATEKAQAANAALRESRSDARLGKFIRDRATSADYAQYLGLIAMIHRDFDTMSRLMKRAASGDSSGLPRVDRIVLYIDDLDRCYPPERVVRVLEAVHLLLFFPLFVVFVGVDSRWVSRSLNRYYDQMLSDESLAPRGNSPSTHRAPANSQDFLEKIFQVPFWLRRMDPPAVQRMIHSLITPAEIETAGAVAVAASGEGPSADVQAGVQESSPPVLPGPGKAPDQTVAAEAELDSAALGEPRPSELPTEALRISQTELDFMDKVAPLMPRTPRSVKRFVNIYRLYKAALSTNALASFLGTPEHAGNFRAVQVLLALVIGTPDFAKSVVTVLDDLAETDNATLATLPGMIPLDERQPTWHTTLDALAKFAQGDDDLRLTQLREVSPLVTRYSVHHMISDLPGESTLG